ncbi:MAG: adenylate/guanylate cyclase domain-containing protein [Polyangiaceae bacterium]
MSVLERWIGAGTGGALTPAELRRVRLCNLSALLGVLTTLGFAISYALADLRAYAPIAALNLFDSLLMAATLAWNVRGMHRVARIWIMSLVNFHVAAACLLASRQAGFQAYFFIFPAVTLLLMPARGDRAPRWLLTIASAALYLLVEHHPAWTAGHVPLPAWSFAPIRAVSAALTFATLAFVVFQFYLDILRAEDALAQEHERSEGLLRNILPVPIASRLKSDKHSIADGFAEVTVLFSDLVGFTELSGRLPPADLVKLLNRVFSEFDDLTERRGLEKIKTIGDAYMVAAGLPEPRPDHALAVARFAFDMLAVLGRINAETGQKLDLRIGIHTGPVVAGVIGKRKFIYDLWGDTVNIASRMESHGVAGAVQVTPEVARRIEGEFEISPPRTILVKGKGEMTTHLLIRRKVVTFSADAARAAAAKAASSASSRQ